MENYAGLIEMVFFYGIAISFGVWQWWKMRSELKSSRAERAEREAAERADTTPSDAAPPEASDRAT